MLRIAPLSCACLSLVLLGLGCADDGALDSSSSVGDSEESGTGTPSSESSSASNSGDGDGDPATGDGDGDPSGDGDMSGDGDGDPSGDGDGDPSGDGDGDMSGDGDGDPGSDTFLRFIAMGDAGEGNDGQYNVAAAIEAVCADKGGCEFVLYLGDNFYDDGVSSVEDDQFQSKFEQPYADLSMPFYVIMGNHDYGELSLAFDKLEYEVEYTDYSDKWFMPNNLYTVTGYDDVDFFMMDTTLLMWNFGGAKEDQQDWLDAEVAASDKRWKIAMAHHPYLSNGAHGNAGNYEGLPFPPQAAGTTVKEVLDESVCDKVDLYLSGHDHNRQWNVGTCGGQERETHFIVTGAGCKTTDFEYHDDNEVYWEDDTTPGFLVLELEYDQIHTEFYDENGQLEFERDIVK